MTQNEILQSALRKVEAQQDNFGFMDRFNVDEHWAVRSALEEIIAFREIGFTPLMVKDLIASEKKANKVALENAELLDEYQEIGTVEEFEKSVKEEDILKFYYIESEDKYVVGRRLDTMYYAEIGINGLAFYMSRYLPWGKEGYPSEPKEIPFFDWLQGFIKKECGGTIDECRTAVERMKPKKPVYQIDTNGTRHSKCPNCESFGVVNYCIMCGQAIETDRSE